MLPTDTNADAIHARQQGTLPGLFGPAGPGGKKLALVRCTQMVLW